MPTAVPTGVFELVGARKVGNDLRLLTERLRLGTVALEAEFEVLEQAEELLFESYGGRFVKTGDLKASLTQSSADGAIRRIHGDGVSLEFGTSIWYARFQRRIGGPSGKPRGRKRLGPNLVLKLTPTMRRDAVNLIADYVMGRV